MRLIDADRLKAEITGWCVVTDDLFGMGRYHEREIVLQAIEESPTIDAVPVVRCSECISHGTLTNGNLYCGKIKTGIYGYYRTVKADDYCSYGERKEG